MKNRIVMCPFMAIGHITPMLEFANHLVNHLHFTISFLIPGKSLLHRVVPKAAESDAEEQSKISYEVVDFGELEVEGGTEYVTSPGLRKIDMNKDDYQHFAKVVYPKWVAIRAKLHEVIQSTNPCCVIMDPLLFAGGIVPKYFLDPALNLPPLYAFIPFSATSVACFRYLMNNGFSPPAISIPELGFDLLEHDFSATLIPDGIHPQGLVHRDRNKLMEKLCAGIILNTWDEIEAGSIEALRKADHCCFPKPISDSVFAVGPMISTSSSVFRSDGEGYARCKDWLDQKPQSSVLLVCFGSWLLQSDEQMEELALGIEESGVSFIWVLKNGDRLPWLERFEERTKNKGLILQGWAPQQYILSHEAVGGFVMTCGWNSVLEALVLSPRGLVFVAWPIYEDHLPTCRLLVDELKICVEVQGSMDGHYGIVKRADVARAAGLAINGPDAAEMRERAFKLGEMSVQALKPGGSSFKQTEAFAKKVSRK